MINFDKRHGKMVVLNTVCIGLLIASWFLGGLPIVLAADKFFATYLFLGLVGLVIWLVHKGDVENSKWLTGKFTSIGLIFTVMGLLAAAHGYILANGTMMTFQLEVINALVGNLGGIVGALWADLNVKFCSSQERVA